MNKKWVFITGASSGIGKACARKFAEQGYPLIICARRRERLEELTSTLTSTYQVEVKMLVFDIRNKVEIKNSLNQLGDEIISQIGILINNAGLAKGLDPIHEGELDHWETMIDTNIKGLLYITRWISPFMVKEGKGHIINVGSIAGKEVYAKGSVYCATKFAVDALTKGMRLDLHDKGIKVSQVSPGHVEETEFALVRFDGDREKSDIYKDFTPLKASDVADAIWFITSRPSHVNIQDILLMGTQQASATVIHRSGRDL